MLACSDLKSQMVSSRNFETFDFQALQRIFGHFLGVVRIQGERGGYVNSIYSNFLDREAHDVNSC